MKKSFFVLVVVLISHFSFAQIHRGVLEIVEFPENEALKLNGEWRFYPEKLLAPEEIDGSNAGNPIYLDVPSTWNAQGLEGRGYGTYHLRLVNVPVNRMLGLFMPNVYSSYKLFIDDQLISSNGRVSDANESAVPQWNMAACSFITQNPIVEITLQVSNFDHYRGGIHKEITLGTFSTIQREKENKLLANMLLFAGLTVLGLFCLMVFFIQVTTEKLNILFFGLLCITWATRAFFSHIYLRTVFFPDMDWGIAVRMEYILMYISLILGNLFVKYSFDLKDKLSFNLIMVVNILMIGITIIFKPLVFTSLVGVYQAIAVVNLLYLAYMIINAIVNKKKEAWFTGLSVALAIVIFLLDLLAYQFQWHLGELFFNASYLIVFLMNSLVLAYQATLSDRKLEEMHKRQMAF